MAHTVGQLLGASCQAAIGAAGVALFTVVVGAGLPAERLAPHCPEAGHHRSVRFHVQQIVRRRTSYDNH